MTTVPLAPDDDDPEVARAVALVLDAIEQATTLEEARRMARVGVYCLRAWRRAARGI